MLVAAQNFRDLEYIVPRAFWEQNNVDVSTVSAQYLSTGRFGYRIRNDFLIGDIEDPDSFDGIFLVGGAGILEYLEDSDAAELVGHFVKQGKPVGAICAAPRTLLKWGYLQNRVCTGHNWDGEFGMWCVKYGASFDARPVVVDGNFLTANGPEAAESAAVEFLALLSD